MYYIGWNMIYVINLYHIYLLSEQNKKFQQDSDNESDLNIKLAIIFSP